MEFYGIFPGGHRSFSQVSRGSGNPGVKDHGVSVGAGDTVLAKGVTCHEGQDRKVA